MKRAIFFDKDGTLVENVPFNVDPDKIKFNPGAHELLRAFKDDFEFHIITNQAGVALGHFAERDLLVVERKMAAMFKEVGASLAGFHYCPHHPQGTIPYYTKNCHCRKPGTELLEKARLDFHLSLQESWLIGDILDDIEAGNRAGMKTILLDIGNETEWKLSEVRKPHFSVSSLHEILSVIKEGHHE